VDRRGVLAGAFQVGGKGSGSQIDLNALQGGGRAESLKPAFPGIFGKLERRIERPAQRVESSVGLRRVV